VICAGAAGCAAVGDPPVEKPFSFVELKFAATVRQTFDFSCGAAALATILTYYWGVPTTEIAVMTVLRSRYPGQDWTALQDHGFSFDDLIWAAGELGFEAQGAEVSAEQLAELDGPVIVHLDKGKFQHFSVARAAKVGHVFLSDPVVGAVTMSLGEFKQQYTGSALAVWKRGAPLAKSAILGRPIAPLDPSLVIGGIESTPSTPSSRMIGR
jgi:predicted double-glycine peptidase